MYLKAVAMIVFITALAAGMLALRQQRWESKHEITRMHQQMEQSRRATWEGQVKVASELQPDKLEYKIALSQMAMEPITATNDPALQRLRVVGDRIPLKSAVTNTTNTKDKDKDKNKNNRAGTTHPRPAPTPAAPPRRPRTNGSP
jgi:hypothetical protein